MNRISERAFFLRKNQQFIIWDMVVDHGNYNVAI